MVAGFLAFSSTARAAMSCSWISVVNVNFGAYDVFSAVPNDSTGTLTFKCSGTPAKPIAIKLSRGNAPTYNPRYMLRSTEQLNYNLYLDSARTSIWGDGTSGTSYYTNNNPPLGSNVSLTVYGRVPASQDVTAGAYNDMIVVTLTY